MKNNVTNWFFFNMRMVRLFLFFINALRRIITGRIAQTSCHLTLHLAGAWLKCVEKSINASNVLYNWFIANAFGKKQT